MVETGERGQIHELSGRHAPASAQESVEPLGANAARRHSRREDSTLKVHVEQLTVEWAHCDAARIVFYPNFYAWFDQGTERLFRANGLSYAELARDFGVTGMPLLETGARYENPCRLGDQLAMRTWVDEWANRTFLVKHALTHADGRPALEGFERRAWVIPDPTSPKGMRAIPIPREVVDRFTD